MNSLMDSLPPGWQRNEADYWANRAQLLTHSRDQWIGFANGRVIASGTSPVDVLHAAQQSGLHPFVTCDGREPEPCQMRRVVFSYDPTYPSEALPAQEVALNP